MADSVVLVPGFFGFGAFGKDTPHPVSYFDHVVDAIVGARPVLREWIVVAEPPPTGSLSGRARSLHDTNATLLADGVGGDRTRRPARVHLIGHSTGGLDARLLMNDRFALDPPPDPAARATVRAAIGTVVTLSAPLHGSPIAVRLGGVFRLALPGLFFLSILAKVREQLHFPWDSTMMEGLLEMFHERRIPNASALLLLAGMSPATASEIERFLGRIVDDPALIDDLRPDRMQALNARVAPGDVRALASWVTVAPAPHVVPSLADVAAGPLALVFRQLYATTWTATASTTFRPADVADGPWLAGADRGLPGDAPRANDGVVPSSSQVLGGRAQGIVEGDHLDVIGHYASASFDGTTVFRSGAAFDDARFRMLWQAIAREL